MALGSLGEGPGYSHAEGDKTTAVVADKFFSQISMYGHTVLSIQVFFNENSGSLAGVLKIQGSNENKPTANAAGTNEWDTLDVAFNRDVTTGIGMASINLADVGWRWLRVWFDYSSGTGSVRILTVIKVQ